jgi:hypothetical protein
MFSFFITRHRKIFRAASGRPRPAARYGAFFSGGILLLNPKKRSQNRVYEFGKPPNHNLHFEHLPEIGACSHYRSKAYFGGFSAIRR